MKQMTDQPEITPSGNLNRSGVRLAVGYTVLLVVASIALPLLDELSITNGKLTAEWELWLAVLQVVGMLAIVRFAGLPKNKPEWLVILAANGLLATIALLFALKSFDFVFTRTLEVTVRFTAFTAWTIAVFGLPIVITQILKRRKNRAATSMRFAKWWFSTTLFLLLAEPLFLLIDKQADRLNFPHELSQPAKGELHVAALGGSSVVGHPYDSKYSFPIVVKQLLKRTYPHQRVHMHNLARAGQNLRQAIGCLHELQFRPHILLLYSGHNEFFHEMDELAMTADSPFSQVDRWLAFSPFCRFLSRKLSQRKAIRGLRNLDDRRLIQHRIASNAIYPKRVARYRSQLKQLADYCRTQKIPTVWFVPAGSESGFEPNRSAVHLGTTDLEKEQVERLYERAKILQDAKNWNAAASLYRRGLADQPDFAEFHFQLAECLFRLGEYRQAAFHYGKALDTDGHPIRTNKDFRETVLQVAAEEQVPCLVAADLLRPRTAHGILDSTVFHDFVHPTLKTNFILATAAVKLIQQNRLLDKTIGPAVDSPKLTFAESIRLAGFSAEDLAIAYGRTSHDLRWLKRWRFDDVRREREANEYERWSQQLKSGEISPGDDGTESFE